MNDDDKYDEHTKWYYITVLVAIIMYGSYKITELYFDRIEILQKQSQVIIDK